MNYANLYRDTVDDLVEQNGKAEVADIYDAMIAGGAPMCVAREYSNEPIRRAAMRIKAEARVAWKKRRLENLAKMLDVTQSAFNRIVCRKETVDPNNAKRIIVKDFHATKGWRQSYKLADA